MTPGAAAPESIDTRLVFRVYAWIAGLATVLFVVVLSRIINFSGAPNGPIATLGMGGAITAILTSYAVAFARIADPAARGAGLRAFAIAHLAAAACVAGLFAIAETSASSAPLAVDLRSMLPGWLPYPWVATNLFTTGAVLLYLGYTATPAPRFMAVLRQTAAQGGAAPTMARVEREKPASLQRLRSQYEEQIRQAARQEERARLARDLHDAVKQQLFVIQTAAATTQARFDSDRDGARDALEQIRTAAREALAEMAAMLDQLQAAPVENVGLVEALKKQCEALRFRTGAQVTFEAQPLPAPAVLPTGAQQALFRVAQEALANVARHARARNVVVRLVADGRSVRLEVEDDGAGFDPVAPSAGMGLRNMQERAAEVGGSLDLASSSGGTTVVFAVPRIARSAGHYAGIALGCAAAFAVCGVGVMGANGVLVRAAWLTAAWITGIAAARYVVACVRVVRLPGAAV